MIKQTVSQTSNAIAEYNFFDLVVLIEHRIMRSIVVCCTRATQQQFAVVIENIVDVFTALSGRQDFACCQVIYLGLQFGNLTVHRIQPLLQFVQCDICLCHFDKHLCYSALAKDALAVTAFALICTAVCQVRIQNSCRSSTQSYNC